MVKIFVTGGTGWTGSHVVPELLAHGHQITAIARSDATAKKLEDQGVTVLRGSLEDLDVLSKGAAGADAVIHMGYIHDFTQYGKKSADVDLAAIRALATPLEGTNKLLVVTSGTGSTFTPRPLETQAAVDLPVNPRGRGEVLALSFVEKGVRVINVRLPFTVHGPGDIGFVKLLVNAAKEKGFSAYVDEGENVWPAVHVNDAARLFRLAVETPASRFPSSGLALHGVGDEGIPTKEIARKIGEKLGVETKSIPKAEAIAHFGFVGMIFGLGCNPSRALTTEWTGWEPKEVGLLEDLETGTYFD
ncbi:hypothetical protein IAR55_003300 [Kwoniella newhampshirensis]|uniref:NAD-dependent epimerase/dehydratase domain-containing protein n=1 Tax=Kwoniella newhampshirensis TaxID=1651941 RepID=A0AAW0YQJ3_9TREE